MSNDIAITVHQPGVGSRTLDKLPECLDLDVHNVIMTSAMLVRPFEVRFVVMIKSSPRASSCYILKVQYLAEKK